MSDELKQFYRELWAWVQDGCPEHAVFHTQRALCPTLSSWSIVNGLSVYCLRWEQSKLFEIWVGGSGETPFNLDSNDWVRESHRPGGVYHNSKRLVFIEEHAK